MPPKAWGAVKDLLRAYARLRIDMVLMSGMLAKAQVNQVPPQDWHSELMQLRQLPAHRDALQELEALLHEV